MNPFKIKPALARRLERRQNRFAKVKLSRRRRKVIARGVSLELGTSKIISCSEASLAKAFKQLKSMYEAEKYSNW